MITFLTTWFYRILQILVCNGWELKWHHNHYHHLVLHHKEFENHCTELNFIRWEHSKIQGILFLLQEQLVGCGPGCTEKLWVILEPDMKFHFWKKNKSMKLTSYICIPPNHEHFLQNCFINKTSICSDLQHLFLVGAHFFTLLCPNKQRPGKRNFAYQRGDCFLLLRMSINRVRRFTWCSHVE